MTFEHGAAACLKLGVHQWQVGGPGWRDCEQCARCGRVRARRFTDDEIDQFDAADANRAEHEASGNPSDNEADAHRGWPE